LATSGAAHHLQTGRSDRQDTSVPEYLSRHITTPSSTWSLRSSSAPLLHIPFRRTSFGKRSFSTAAPSVWNSLPVFLQICDTLTLFKSRLKAHLFSSVYASSLSCSPAPLKPRQHGAVQISYYYYYYYYYYAHDVAPGAAIPSTTPGHVETEILHSKVLLSPQPGGSWSTGQTFPFVSCRDCAATAAGCSGLLHCTI